MESPAGHTVAILHLFCLQTHVSPSVLSLLCWFQLFLHGSGIVTLHARQRQNFIIWFPDSECTDILASSGFKRVPLAYIFFFFMCITKKGTRIKLANEHSTETAHLKSVKRVFQLTYNPFFLSISSPCQKRHLQEHFLCATALLTQQPLHLSQKLL